MAENNNQQEAELTPRSDDATAPSEGKLSPKDLLEITWKLGAFLSVACYVIGSIVVNIHFSRYGYYSVSLVNAQYLIAGVWAIAPVALAWFMVLSGLLQEGGMLQWPRGDTTRIIILLALIVAVVASFILVAILPVRLEGASRILKWTVVGGAGFFLTLPIGAVIWWLNPVGSLTRKWIPLTVLAVFIAGLFALSYVQAFSLTLYGEISGTLGGGKPRVVRLVMLDEARADMITAGISFPEESHTSGSLKLLTATDKEYVVLTERGNSSISIRSDLVKAVLYEGEGK
jgi:hypothetical protein